MTSKRILTSKNVSKTMNNTSDKEEISHEFSKIMITIVGPIGGRCSLLSAMITRLPVNQADSGNSENGSVNVNGTIGYTESLDLMVCS